MKRLIFDTDVKAIRDEKLRGNYPNIHCENDLIDAVPTADLSELWIPVTERLPEKYKIVLCYKAKQYRLGYYFGANYSKDVAAFRHPKDQCAFGVTHWMPLPGVPKKEDRYDDD